MKHLWTRNRFAMTAGAGLGVSLFAYLYSVAYQLGLDNFDSFQLFLPARTFSETLTLPTFFRGYIYVLMLSPAFGLEHLLGQPGLGFRLCHLFAVTLFLGQVVLLYLLYRLPFPPGRGGRLQAFPALLATALFALHPLLLHTAVISKEDVPATFFTTLAFYLFFRGKLSGRRGFSVGAALAAVAAMGTRYNLVPVVFGVFFLLDFVFSEIGETWPLRSRSRKEWGSSLCLFLIPASLFFLVFPVVFHDTFGDGVIWKAPWRFLYFLWCILRSFAGRGDSARLNYVFLFRGLTPAVSLLFLYGTGSAWIRRVAGRKLHTIWFLVFFILQTYVIGWKEARYLFPLLPAVYFFVGVGMQELFVQLGRVFPRRPPWVVPFALVLIFVGPAGSAARELVRFTDPIYRSTYERDLSNAAARLSPGGDIVWLGPPYPLHPKRYVFDLEDRYTSLYHFYGHVVEFYTRRKVTSRADVVRMARAGQPPVLLPRTLTTSGEEVLIVNFEPAYYETKTLPATLHPLLVARLKFLPYPAAPAGNYVLYRRDPLGGPLCAAAEVTVTDAGKYEVVPLPSAPELSPAALLTATLVQYDSPHEFLP